ncbi:MAG: hypothetical protein KDE31_31820 [Caldilineaceae bacterium]|nr:hypothetical protein [Caldilineaceae bacterium]
MNFNAMIIGLALVGGLLIAVGRLRSSFTEKPINFLNLPIGSWGLILIVLSILMTIIEGMMQ